MIQTLEGLSWLANLFEILGFAILIITVISTLITLFNTRILRTEQREANKRITLVLEVKDNDSSASYTLPGAIRRKDFSRAEIMGRLGMIPLEDESKRFFTLGYVQKNPKFLKDIEEIYDLKEDAIMTIPCTQAEYDQFKFN